MEDNERLPRGELLLLIKEAERLTHGLCELRKAIGATALEELDDMTHYYLGEMSVRLGVIASSIGSLAGRRPLAREARPQPPEESVLYEAILGPEFRPLTSVLNFRERPTMLHIQDDATLVVGGKIIRLSREEIFIFNKLLLRGEECGTSYFAQKFRWAGQSLSNAKVQARSLIKGLQHKFGEEIIYQFQTGRSRNYYLSRNVMLIDSRNVEAPEKADNIFTPASDMQAAVAAKEKIWGDADYIAVQAGVPAEVARAFIALHRSKIGNIFSASQMLSQPGPNKHIRLQTEHFSPGFVVWAIAGLREAKAAYESRRQDPPPERETNNV